MIGVPLIKPDLPDFALLEDGFREILESGKVTNFGKYVSAFEREVRAFLDAEAVTVSSGTAGLILALQASGLEPGDKVILLFFSLIRPPPRSPLVPYTTLFRYSDPSLS